MSDDAREIEALGLGLEPLAIDRANDGPDRFFGRDGVVAWAASEARIRDERAGLVRAEGHALAPTLVAATTRAIAFQVSDEGDAIEALVASVPRTVVTETTSARAHLDAIGGPVSIAKSLGRVLGRARADRFLARELSVTTGRGRVLGGIDPRWIVRGRSLSWRRSMEGWAALDLAAADAHGHADLRSVHEALFGDTHAYDLALIAILAREATLGRGETAERAAERVHEIVERLAPRESASEVRVRVVGPSWLPVERWEGDRVPIAQARWVARELDGLAVGGTIVRVETEPSIRPGRAAPAWRPRSERRHELFSRWGEGVRTDDEGLFSATPERIASRFAEGLSGTVIDGTCGIGSITIALARMSSIERVIAVDLDAERLALARHNAAIYGVVDRIEWIAGDVNDVVRSRRADALVLDPPWGGRDYDRENVGIDGLGLDLRPLLESFEGPVVLKLPRSFDVAQLPGAWSIEPAIDDRNVIKMLIARRGLRRSALREA